MLFVAEGFDGVEVGGLDGGDHSADGSDDHENRSGDNDGDG